MGKATYIHGTTEKEQSRLAALNELTNSAFIQFLELKPDHRVLEVGSGLGLLANLVAERVPHGEVMGVELSEQQLGRVQVLHPNLRFQQADAHHLPFPDARFDVAYCRYLLEHVADPLRVLREMFRVLRPGGKSFAQENNILINVFYPDCPVFEAIWSKFVLLQRKLGGDALIGKRLFALFGQAGFKEISLSIAPEIHHAGQPTFVAWIENLMGNVEGAADKLIEFGYAAKDELEAAQQELEALKVREDGSAYFYWNRAIGTKSIIN